jgi:hypothetical protein
MLSIDANVDSDSAVAWQLRQYGWPASGMSMTMFGILARSCRTLPVGYHDGSFEIGSGKVPPVNADRSRSGGGNCGGSPMFGCCSVQSQPSCDALLDLTIGAQRIGWIGFAASSAMSMQPSAAVRMSRLVQRMLIAFMIIAPSGISPCRPLQSQSTTSGE